VVETLDRFLPWYSSIHRGTGFKSALSSEVYDEARAIVGRFFGADPAVMAAAAAIVQDSGADVVDINFGCAVRKVVKEGAGARTQVANLVTWVVTILTVLFLTPLFATLPEAVLGALIIHALWHIVVARKLQRIRLVSRTEFWLGVITLLGVLLIDVLEGMLIGLLASLVLVIARSSRPHISALGGVPGVPGAYTALERHPENVPVPGVLILRLDSPMTYYNALTIRDRIKAMIAAEEPRPHAVILDAAVQDQLDLTSAEVMKKLVTETKREGIGIYVAELHEPAVQFARRIGPSGILEEGHRFPTVDAAVRSIEGNG
jgi:MFS superfamily sulfate permease-like transporter